MNALSEVEAERRLRRILRIVRRGLPAAGRYRRYVLTVAPVIVAIWSTTAIYLVAVPRSYTSQFSLILPGSGIGSSINVESIGQAQISTNSAYSSSTLSPTENYKQLLTADVTLRAAARLLHENEDRFPAPTIKLVDQTNLINIAITGRSAKQAHDRAIGLQRAFFDELDQLRADEASKREVNDIRHLNELATKVKTAQRKLIDFQASHGLATLDQFNSRIASVDTLRQRARDLSVQVHQQGGTAERLAGTLGANPHMANIVLQLRGDPIFAELAQRYAVAHADAETKAGTLGPRHASRAQAEAERNRLLAALVRRGTEVTGQSAAELLRHTDMQVSEGRSALMQAMSLNDAQAEGTREALAEVRRDIDAARAQAPEWIQLAQQLADLQRDQRVTEAVFSSALARLDTNKQDPFASYPLVQVLAAPSLPEKPSSPSKAIGLGGAAAATILVLIAFGLLWLRQPILDRMLPKH